MVKVHFVNEDISIEVAAGESLSKCIKAAGLNFETPCNGLGLCGKCRVKTGGELYPPEELESGFVDTPGIRLACQARVKGDVWIELPTNGEQLKTINQGFAKEVEVDCSVKQVLLPSPEKTARAYLERLPYNLCSVDIYRKAGNQEQVKNQQIYGVLFDSCLIDLRLEPDKIWGIALDIGTTGISAYLVDLATGEVVKKGSCLNPQTQYGGDVLSRISYCLENSTGVFQLQEVIISKLNQLVLDLIDSTAGKTENIYQVVIAGNTTMLHLLLGVYPGSIAKSPYRPVFLEQINLKARETGLAIFPEGMVTLLPSASAYVGADILAGVVATAFDKKNSAALFLDIGTNGEIVANLGGRLIATSTAAGPALEGMNISCGCRAEEGAIDTFLIDDDYKIHFTTIGEDAIPKGICGSGLIDIIASLVKKQIVLANGRFNPGLDQRLKTRLRDKKFYLTEDIYLSQRDIRQIQLAKGAIAAGVTLLLEEVGIPLETVEEAVIAGAFGYHINPASIREIGLLPKGFMGKITFVGNSSAEGARLALINKGVMNQISGLKNKIEILELSLNPNFQDYFVKALGF